MKYPQTQYTELKSALVVLKEHYKIDKQTAIENASYLHYVIFKQLTYPLENLNVVRNADGSRLMKLNEAFKLYPEGCNEAHVNTAMKNAIKEIF